ncbi:hypothetical protein PC116_g23161 [Phytophthora cactorum]|uniref:Uncharacterized protein n=1 Tax=Phytophthora cactorum TaxID=29920 RepID=A0A8T0YHI2_9STRA|nr:hypothetical protein PC112_g19209 [Phytophthora cactorum]KAG2841079.1 hypothetical protein PC113_g19102 [Phytophthora cactorum]KAG2893330.1 hypothetical protein PC115_g18505 [Phytophthora cactorum]KAG2967107.1 hypothetical protein PC118_g18784 [Phytophthora cactorum]KAG2984529.1 hypothetical protein PC119_g20390 [Phytophthora cactorum]
MAFRSISWTRAPSRFALAGALEEYATFVTPALLVLAPADTTSL